MPPFFFSVGFVAEICLEHTVHGLEIIVSRGVEVQDLNESAAQGDLPVPFFTVHRQAFDGRAVVSVIAEDNAVFIGVIHAQQARRIAAESFIIKSVGVLDGIGRLDVVFARRAVQRVKRIPRHLAGLAGGKVIIADVW